MVKVEICYQEICPGMKKKRKKLCAKKKLGSDFTRDVAGEAIAVAKAT